MSSRQEEKAQKRAEREAVEAAAKRADARSARLRLATGGIAAVAAIVAVVLVIGANTGGGTGDPVAAAASAPIPAQKITDLRKAVDAASCKLTSPKIRGQTHVPGEINYPDNPPSSGNHNPEPALDGIYVPGTSPEPENWVHSLEHGRIVVQYRPGTPKQQIAQFETLVTEELGFGRPSYLSTLLQNTTKVPAAVVAVAWGKLLTCNSMNPRVYDAIRAFRTEFTLKAPETGVPPTN